MTSVDEEKKILRANYRALRRARPTVDKIALDRKLIPHIIKLVGYANARTVLTYISTADEIDTAPLIDHAWRAGKRVAVPYCIPGTRQMQFYVIRSRDDLKPGAYGILEPDPAACKALSDFSESLCIVPAFAFDRDGYRLGYGGGYYDRFLAAYPGHSVGLCYAQNLCAQLPRDRYDQPVDTVVTQDGAVACPAIGQGKGSL